MEKGAPARRSNAETCWGRGGDDGVNEVLQVRIADFKKIALIAQILGDRLWKRGPQKDGVITKTFWGRGRHYGVLEVIFEKNYRKYGVMSDEGR